MSKRVVVTFLVYLAMSAVFASIFVESGAAAPPVITEIYFPNQFDLSATRFGQITFEDIDSDVLFARLDVADGRYYRQVVAPADKTTLQDGRLSFSLDCTSYGQKVTLAVTLFDAQQERSEPSQLSFICGQPSVYNFDFEQAEALTYSEQIPLNLFIVDDGITALAEGASFSGGSLLGAPHPAVAHAIRSVLMPNLTGIWDQCGYGFELINVWVVKPGAMELSGRTLEQALFSTENGRRVIRHGREAADLLRQATRSWWLAAQEADPRAALALNVLIVGASILADDDGMLSESEGFSESVWPNYAVVRSGTFLNGVLPKQMISTLAHELGHNLGLAHPGEDDLRDALSDPMNLMLGSGVSPQPRANLINSQCEKVRATYITLKNRLESQTGREATVSGESVASVHWKKTCPELICSGKIELVVEAKGFADLENFGFASFEYSEDGEHFIEIGVDRRYQDGFTMAWDTTKLKNGLYTVRAVVTDAKGIRAMTTLEIAIQND